MSSDWQNGEINQKPWALSTRTLKKYFFTYTLRVFKNNLVHIQLSDNVWLAVLNDMLANQKPEEKQKWLNNCKEESCVYSQ